jgi:gluconate kinase
MMVGLPGSGKSFFASQFAATFNAPYIDSLSVEEYARDAEGAGAIITLIMGEIAKTHQTFIFEGNADTRTRRAEFAKWARQLGYQPLFIWTQVDHVTSRDRTAKAKTMSQTDFEHANRTFSAPHADEKAIVISGKHTFASQAKVVLAHLSKETRSETPPAPQQPHAPSRPAGSRSIIIR